MGCHDLMLLLLQSSNHPEIVASFSGGFQEGSSIRNGGIKSYVILTPFVIQLVIKTKIFLPGNFHLLQQLLNYHKHRITYFFSSQGVMQLSV